MAYDPGAIDATLAAAVGDDPGLIAELRIALVDSAELAIAAGAHVARLDGRDLLPSPPAVLDVLGTVVEIPDGADAIVEPPDDDSSEPPPW